MKNSVSRWLFLALFGLVISTGVVTNALSAELIYNSWNGAGTANGPTVDTVFTLTKPTTIAALVNYHWNNGAGQDAATVNAWIGIERIVSGKPNVLVGQWPVTSKPGAYGMEDTWWYAYPNLLLAPGTYKIIDSDPATWSFTDGGSADGPDWEAGKGFTQVLAAAEVTTTVPANGATGVKQMQALTITFSENIAPGPAWDKITITYPTYSGKKQIIKSVPVIKTLSGNVLVITPKERFQENTLMTVTLPAGSLQDTGNSPWGTPQPEPAYPAAAHKYTFITKRN